MYCKMDYYVKRDYILLLCIVMKPKIKHFTLLYCIIWQNYIIVYYTLLLKHFYYTTMYFTSIYSTFLITQRENISIRLIEFMTIGVLCYNTESCI